MSLSFHQHVTVYRSPCPTQGARLWSMMVAGCPRWQPSRARVCCPAVPTQEGRAVTGDGIGTHRVTGGSVMAGAWTDVVLGAEAFAAPCGGAASHSSCPCGVRGRKRCPRTCRVRPLWSSSLAPRTCRTGSLVRVKQVTRWMHGRGRRRCRRETPAGGKPPADRIGGSSSPAEGAWRPTGSPGATVRPDVLRAGGRLVPWSLRPATMERMRAPPRPGFPQRHVLLLWPVACSKAPATSPSQGAVFPSRRFEDEVRAGAPRPS